MVKVFIDTNILIIKMMYYKQKPQTVWFRAFVYLWVVT